GSLLNSVVILGSFTDYSRLLKLFHLLQPLLVYYSVTSFTSCSLLYWVALWFGTADKHFITVHTLKKLTPNKTSIHLQRRPSDNDTQYTVVYFNWTSICHLPIS